ncbi:hypothetical protein FSP39_021256 [Pinctada imbricata]|uniref:SMC hinge domain-containing protein n=1 Tax=Pinctada imbricata TaxID=66713 RepID=A0AA88XND3_PINIB|nr:hypothetical protein FSP39_021256 [Pinctada imbricata]
MAASRRSGLIEVKMEEDDAFVYVFDRRATDAPEVKIATGGLFSFDDFKARVREALNIGKRESFVLATTNREEIEDDPSWDNIDKGDTLYILRDINQELCAPAQERVTFLPHYDTIVKGGLYEYYASEGQNPLPYAFAELIDNALSATADNEGPRKIEIRLHFDESKPQNSCVFIVDNGKGMNPRQLNNWAIYRLSKFKRIDQRGKVSFIEGEDDETVVEQAQTPLSLNSDISYFGVGGKQACFFIGRATRIKRFQDVHELTISKEEFKQKEINREAIYSGVIRNRQPADNSHISEDQEVLRSVVEEEKGKESFTTVAITSINAGHIPYLRHRIKEWTRQLAHIYHYYIHGPQGNINNDDDEEEETRSASPFKNIDIQIKLYTKKSEPYVINLRDIYDDMQSQYVQSAASQFFFKATVEGTHVVEGVMRYHPFLYDRETYPSDINDPRVEQEFDEHDYAMSEKPARGRRPIFECFWNGRLIPYTFIHEFDWCTEPRKSKSVPPECFNRVSGALFTNDHFQVSTNKLTFIDLEMRMKEKSTIYARITNNQEKRTAIDREFSNWLKECHENEDKQIHYTGNFGKVVREDLPKAKQTPWTEFKSVEWDNRTWKAGQLVRIGKAPAMFLGTIRRFFLYGEHEGDVYATGGEIEVQQEPQSLYDEIKAVPLSKLDRFANPTLVKRYIEEEESKLPDALVVTWPDGFAVHPGDKRQAGKTIGALKIQIQNKKGEFIQKLPGTASSQKKLLVELKVIWHGPMGDEVIVSHISQHGKTWPYWFRKMENIKNLGPHTLQLQVVLNESGNNIYAGKELPYYKVKFNVTEAEPEKFTVGMLEGPFRIGVPFQIPLEFRDAFNNVTKPIPNASPTIEASGLEISYTGTQVKANSLLLKGIEAKGEVSGTKTSAASFNLTIKVPELNDASQSLKIRLLPGVPHTIHVSQPDDFEIENGSATEFDVEVRDVSGNITTDPVTLTCKFTGASGLPTYTAKISSGTSTKLTGEPIIFKKLKDSQTITAVIEVQGNKEVAAVERRIKVVPSGGVSSISVHMMGKNNKKKDIKDGEVINAVAGDTIKGLSFTLIDEAGREIKINDKLAANIKVNWTGKVNKDTIMHGNLPDIKVPASVSDVKYCQLSIQDKSNMEFSFTVSATPGDPNQIKCKCEGAASVQIGEVLTSEITVVVKDKFGNEVTDLPKNCTQEFQVRGDGLLHDKVKVINRKSVFVITNVQFEGGSIGTKDLKVTWRELRDFVKIEMLAGPPAQVSLPGWNTDETITVLNECKLPRSLVVQLCDEWGNPSRKSDVRIQLVRDTKIKFVPAVMPLKTNAQGQVDFGSLIVAGSRGTYDIQPKAFLPSTQIAGPVIHIQLQPNLSRPVSLKVDYDKKASFVVGDKFPEIKVTMLTEDDQPMAAAKASSLSLKLWKMDAKSQNTPPSRAVSFSPEPIKGSPGQFILKDRKMPESAAVYNIMVTYYDGKYQLFSNVITVDIKPAPPMQLVPNENPGTPTVSNTKNASTRCIVRNLKLDLKDEHGNVSGLGYSGKVHVEIKGPDDVSDIPTFVGGNKKLDFTMTNGSCTLTNLTLQENAQGKDGQEYRLHCSLACPQIAKNQALPPLIIPFLFYNDAKKQSEMSTLSKQRNHLQSAILTYKSLFETTEQLIKELKKSLYEAQQEENKIRDELRGHKIPLVQLQSFPNVEKLIQSKVKENENCTTAPRRCCGLQQIDSHPEVIGKIGHLAEVPEPDIARVLSWHMSSDMDCVVTTSTKRAKEIYRQTQGKQQVLPLDSIFRKNLPDWDKPLPHIRYRHGWKPPGNPAYARSFLIFPDHAEQCKIVFGMLLGDTLILDSLDSANAYRQELVKFTHCPTILTREGDRIRSNGKFGGLMNKAVPLEKLRGAVFGEPLPQLYHTIKSQIDTLQTFKAAMMRSQKAKEELQEQVDYMKTAEMQSQYKECKEAETRLKDLESKLGMTMSGRGAARPAPNPVSAIETVSNSPSPNKKARTAAGASNSASKINGVTSPTPAPSVSVVTPTRQSKRLASMTPSSDDEGRKKLRRK